MNRGTVIVTHHALSRYIERVQPLMSPDKARKQIIGFLNSPRLREAMIRLGAARYRIHAGGIVFCVSAGVVTTCYPL